MRQLHSVGYSGTVEQRAFDVLLDGPKELCEACRRTPLTCESVRQAFVRMRKRGLVETVKAGGARLWFLVPGATRPTDKRGRCANRK